MKVSFQSAPDATLIEYYRKGHQMALNILIERYKDKVFTSIYMLVKDKALAEDFFQDAFLKVIKTIQSGNYSDQGKFLPWVIRIAHNLCMDYFRKQKTSLQISKNNSDEVLQYIVKGTIAPISQLEQSQTVNCLALLLKNLPVEQREVIMLRIYGDMSFKEIAQITQVSINTALGRMRYGLINLRKKIEEKQLVLQ